jgi:hypothetical protein
MLVLTDSDQPLSFIHRPAGRGVAHAVEHDVVCSDCCVAEAKRRQDRREEKPAHGPPLRQRLECIDARATKAIARLTAGVRHQRHGDLGRSVPIDPPSPGPRVSCLSRKRIVKCFTTGLQNPSHRSSLARLPEQRRGSSPGARLSPGSALRAVARACRWQQMLAEGLYTSVSEIGDSENMSKCYVSRILRLTLLAPDTVEAILAGRTDEGIRLEQLERGATGALGGSNWS